MLNAFNNVLSCGDERDKREWESEREKCVTGIIININEIRITNYHYLFAAANLN